MKTATVKAFAKVNFILNIKGKLENGYHGLESFMQAVDLHDTVTVSWEDSPAAGPSGLTVTMDPGAPGLPKDEGNLAYRAAVMMHEAYHPEANEHIDIKIVKRIPVAAGLAGGSADGAAVLTALARLWGIPAGAGPCKGARVPQSAPSGEGGGAPDLQTETPALNLQPKHRSIPSEIPSGFEGPVCPKTGKPNIPADLIALASRLGSDVPFCLISQNGQTAAIATGTGTELSAAAPAKLILYAATPPIDVPTKEVYKETKPSDYLPPAPSFDTALFRSAEEAEEKVKYMGNHLQAPALRLFPEIEKTLKILENSDLEPLKVQLSGSGPTCFAVLKNEPDKKILQDLEKTFAGYKFAGICRSL